MLYGGVAIERGAVFCGKAGSAIVFIISDESDSTGWPATAKVVKTNPTNPQRERERKRRKRRDEPSDPIWAPPSRVPIIAHDRALRAIRWNE